VDPASGSCVLQAARRQIVRAIVLRLATFSDLHRQHHALGLFCATCNRWGEADLGQLVSTGRGNQSLTATRFRCRQCGSVVDKQIRPPVPETGGAVAYIDSWP
jgi:hypothetical protein